MIANLIMLVLGAFLFGLGAFLSYWRAEHRTAVVINYIAWITLMCLGLGLIASALL